MQIGAAQHQLKQNPKMIAERKEFTTVTLRLQNSPAVVEVMNDVMKEQNIKTAQGVIEFVLLDYAKKCLLLTKELEYKESTRVQNQNQREYSEEEITKLRKKILDIKSAFQIINQF